MLSRWVIPLIVAHGDWTPRYLLRFLARRSVRLDPSYWMAIALELSLGWVGVTFLADQYTFPTVGGVLAHVAYLQDFLGVGQISAVFWTLCYEVQFYLFLVGMLVASTALERRTGLPKTALLGGTLLALVGYSLLLRAGMATKPMNGLMVERSYQFGLGIIAWLLASGHLSRVFALPMLAAIVGARLAAGALLEALVIGAAAGVCLLAVRSALCNELANVKPLRFLGRISYSLYLFHGTVLTRGVTVVLMLLAGRSSAQILAIAGLLALLGGSVVLSYIMYRVVELPTMRLSRRIRLDRSTHHAVVPQPAA